MEWNDALDSYYSLRSEESELRHTSLKDIMDNLGEEFKAKEFESFSKTVDQKLAQRRRTLEGLPGKIAEAKRRLDASQAVLKNRHPDLHYYIERGLSTQIRLERVLGERRYVPAARGQVAAPLIERDRDIRVLRDREECHEESSRRYSSNRVERVYDYRTSPPIMTEVESTRQSYSGRLGSREF